MIRLNLLIFVMWTIIPAGIVFTQDNWTNRGGTVSGRITDTTDMSNPIQDVKVVIRAADGTEFITTTDANGWFEHAGIPKGRYLISIYKDGYSTRLGKPVTIVNGGAHFVALKMHRKNNIADLLPSFSVVFALLFCGIITFSIFLFTKRRMREKNEFNKKQ